MLHHLQGALLEVASVIRIDGGGAGLGSVEFPIHLVEATLQLRGRFEVILRSSGRGDGAGRSSRRLLLAAEDFERFLVRFGAIGRGSCCGLSKGARGQFAFADRSRGGLGLLFTNDLERALLNGSIRRGCGSSRLSRSRRRGWSWRDGSGSRRRGRSCSGGRRGRGRSCAGLLAESFEGLVMHRA